MEREKKVKRSSLINKAGKSNNIKPETTYSPHVYTSAPEAPKKTERTTGIRINESTVNKLKAIKSIEKARSMSEVIDAMYYSYQKGLSAEKRKELEFAVKLFNND